MKHETLDTLLPKITITEEKVKDILAEQESVLEAGNRFVSQLSLNHYLTKPLTQWLLDDCMTFFDTLRIHGFVYQENALSMMDIDQEHLQEMLLETIGIDDVYELNEYYIDQYVQGNDVTEKEVVIDGESIPLREVLAQFVFTTMGMSMGDTPNLVLLLTVNRALLGTFATIENILALEMGEREIYDTSLLF